MVCGTIIKIVSHVEDIISEGAHALGAVNVAVGGIAHAAAGLAGIPRGELEGLGVSVEALDGVISPGGTEGHVLDVFAGSVATAIIGAGGTGTALTLVTIEALAFACSTIAKTSAGALSVLVELSLLVGGINPGKLERAHALRAITRVVGLAHTPVVVASTDIISITGSVARAVVITCSMDGNGQNGQQSQSYNLHRCV